MISVTDRFTALAKAIARSAAVGGKSDAQATLNGVQQAVFELPNPIRDFGQPAAPATMEDSFRWGQGFQINGVNAGSINSGPFLARGLWRIAGNLSRSFAGTPAVANSVIVRLSDPLGGALNLLIVPNIVGTVFGLQIMPCIVSLPFDVRVQITTAAQVAGDQLQLDAELLLSRLF